MAIRRKRKKSLKRFLPIVDVGLGIFLGCLFAATYLAFKPVTIRDSVPTSGDKEPGRHDITYVRGRSGLVRGSVVQAKEESMLARTRDGIELGEEEINRWISTKYGDANRSREFEDWDAEFKADLPVFRIRGDATQIGMTFDLSALGITRKVVLQTVGAFQREGGRYVFVPESMYLGSCPVNIPFLSRRIFDAVYDRFEVSSDLRAAWADVRGMVVDRGLIKLDFNAATPQEVESAPEPVADAPETLAAEVEATAEDVSEAVEEAPQEMAQPEAIEPETTEPATANPAEDTMQPESAVVDAPEAAVENITEAPVIDEADGPEEAPTTVEETETPTAETSAATDNVDAPSEEAPMKVEEDQTPAAEAPVVTDDTDAPSEEPATVE